MNKYIECLKSILEWLETGEIDGIKYDEQSIIDDIKMTLGKIKS